MRPPDDETFWDDLLSYIEAGCVIPVLGEGAMTFGDSDQPLYPWLARRLAERLGHPVPEDLTQVTLDAVVTQQFLRQEPLNLVYLRIAQILDKECPEPGPALKALASIDGFRLFLTTTCDPLLPRAIDVVRFAGQGRTTTGAFSPGAERGDLPARNGDLPGPHVHHLFGKASPKPDFVVWEEDALEFIFALHRKLDTLELLARDLKQQNLLVLGLHFSDWLVRFFMRTAKQQRLSQMADLQYLAEGPQESLPESMVLFFGGITKNVSIIPTTPAKFIAELAQRWRQRHPAAEGSSAVHSGHLPEPSMPEQAIFISYAREDEAAAVRVKEGLERAGCAVWFDRERLKPGAHWHAHLEDAVKEKCSLFVSLISQTTESTAEAYYHLERNWAADRLARFSDGEEFYLPLVIDRELDLLSKREPRIVRQRQAILAEQGAVSEEFGRYVRTLQDRRAIVSAPTHQP